jgi:hypothetical protein
MNDEQVDAVLLNSGAFPWDFGEHAIPKKIPPLGEPVYIETGIKTAL